MPARLFDTAPDPVTHEVNSTSFGLFSPVLTLRFPVRTWQERAPRPPHRGIARGPIEPSE
jgi:hypothetical protein